MSTDLRCAQIMLHSSPGLTKNWLADSSVTMPGTAIYSTSMKLRVSLSWTLAPALPLHGWQTLRIML